MKNKEADQPEAGGIKCLVLTKLTTSSEREFYLLLREAVSVLEHGTETGIGSSLIPFLNELKRRDWRIQFQFVYQQGNQVVDAMAKEGNQCLERWNCISYAEYTSALKVYSNRSDPEITICW
ncbi:hypothetical protein V6N13_043364 [Hibiscus sabdariffa]|uniref:RNase H type-1 domain-containing protein n=1 Tax=Hibiscus sabdariffa TaxID=183260 RepID=A0ABR2G2A2_9ROSI